MSGDFAVIGLGQFGRSVALNLVQQGEAVLAIDMDPQRAQLVEAEVDAVVIADATSEAALDDVIGEYAFTQGFAYASVDRDDIAATRDRYAWTM